MAQPRLDGSRGAIAVAAGIAAGSIALIGFGIDSAIEGFASLVIVWRFFGGRLLSSRAETRAQELVGVQFFLLGPYVAAEAIRNLVAGAHPETSWIGVGLAASLAGLLANAGLGWWWADPAAALVIAAVALREGVESWQGDGCCEASC